MNMIRRLLCYLGKHLWSGDEWRRRCTVCPRMEISVEVRKWIKLKGKEE